VRLVALKGDGVIPHAVDIFAGSLSESLLHRVDGLLAPERTSAGSPELARKGRHCVSKREPEEGNERIGVQMMGRDGGCSTLRNEREVFVLAGGTCVLELSSASPGALPRKSFEKERLSWRRTFSGKTKA
jgi:hypothetical protein